LLVYIDGRVVSSFFMFKIFKLLLSVNKKYDKITQKRRGGYEKMDESYKTYFTLVKKYNLLEESERLSLAVDCYFYQQENFVHMSSTYPIGYHKVKGNDLITLATIAKDLNKLNDFCTSYYALDCQFKIKNRQQVAKKFREILTYSTFDEQKIKQEISLVELEEYREYFATVEEKNKYDTLRRTSNYTYRKCGLLIGKMIYEELREDSDRTLIRKWKDMTNQYAKDLIYFVDTYGQIYHQEDIKRTRAILKVMKKGFNYAKMGIILDYIKGLEDLENIPMNYDERFCIEHSLSKRQWKSLLISFKYVEKQEDKDLMTKITLLQEAHQKNVLERINAIFPKLQQQLDEGIYVEDKQCYRKMNVIDFLMQVTLGADEFRDCLLKLQIDKDIIRKWTSFLEENVGRVVHLTFAQKSSWDYCVPNAASIDLKTAKNFVHPNMESSFYHLPTEEERLEVYYGLKKIFLNVPIQMFYRILEAKYGYFKPMEKESSKIKKK